MATKAQRRKIALKNLKKARAARKRNAGMREDPNSAIVVYDAKKARAAKAKATRARKKAEKAEATAKRDEKKVKKARKAAKKSSAKTATRRSPVARKKARKASKKGHKKLTKAQRRAISLRNLAKARAARKSGGTRKRRRSRKTEAVVAAPKRTRRRRKSGSPKKRRMTAKQRRALSHAASKRRERPSRARTTKKGNLNVTVKLVQPRKGRKSTSRKGSSGRRRKSNPIEGGAQWLAGLGGFVTGGVFVGFFDRLAATHPLVAGTTGATGAWNDSPATGQIYNAEAVAAPIWSNITRILVAAVSVVTPFGLAAAVKNPTGKTFLQMVGFGALAVTAVKGVNDVIAMALLNDTSGFGGRVYAPEIMAQTDLNALGATGATALPALSAPLHINVPAANPPTLAGFPRRAAQQLPAFPQARVAPPPVAARPVQAATGAQTPAQLQGMGAFTSSSEAVVGGYFRVDYDR